MKKCVKCGKLKNKSEFYKNKNNKDGLFGKCKECCKKATRSNYRKNIDYYKEYEKKRNREPKRMSDKARYLREHRANNPEKNRARGMVNEGLRRGMLKKEPCVICGAQKTEAHHEDYNKPFDIIWLCRKCHMQYHHGKIKLSAYKVA